MYHELLQNAIMCLLQTSRQRAAPLLSRWPCPPPPSQAHPKRGPSRHDVAPRAGTWVLQWASMAPLGTAPPYLRRQGGACPVILPPVLLSVWCAYDPARSSASGSFPIIKTWRPDEWPMQMHVTWPSYSRMNMQLSCTMNDETMLHSSNDSQIILKGKWVFSIAI